MLLTLFYMISTWVQSWRLSSLKARLTAALNLGLDSRPSIMFYIKQDFVKDDTCKTVGVSDNGQDLLSSQLCRNKTVAKLGDLLWCQGDKRLCTIYPLQIIDVNDWLLYPFGHTTFPLYMNNNGHSLITEDSKMHVLIEAEINHFHPNAFTKIVKLEDYGLIVAWTAEKSFALIIETDLDHMTKLSVALMQSQCFMNNGFSLTRIESVEVSGKPCSYNLGNTVLQDKKLVGKAQFEAHVNRLKYFSSTARHVSQQSKPYEVDNLPGVIISPGNNPLTLQMPTILEINPPPDDHHSPTEHQSNDESYGRITPSTPPPTPAIFNEVNHTTNTLDNVSLALTNSIANSQQHLNPLNPTHPTNASIPSPSPSTSSRTLTSNSNVNLQTEMSRHSPRRDKSQVDVKTEGFNVPMKPPNVLIYADSEIARDNIKSVLQATLNREKYTIYNINADETKKGSWVEQTHLVVICGNVDGEISSQLLEYLVKGGKLLTLCSDALHSLLPSFKTAEVREHELVRFSYGKWKNVRMMHHIFCYQASPIKSRFSQDQEDGKFTAPQPPVSANVRDKAGKSHTFHVKVLGTEETWHTPSIVLADLLSSGGKAIFSQIHLEADPSQYEGEEAKFKALKESNQARLEIIGDLLATHLGMDIKTTIEAPVFTPGFFLGRHELKLQMLENLKDKIENDILEMSKIKLQFCGVTTKAVPASSSILPIMLHQCPENFSTIEYFENLSTKELGRLVIYGDVMTSSMHVVAGRQLHHGLVVIPRQQTQGQGRNKNIWLSPIGCAMFTMQIHVPLNSYIGRHLSIIQHLVAVALVSAVKSIPGYQDIDLRLKWPNDFYAGCQNKIGGTIVTSSLQKSQAICDIGVGINLSNSLPTCCINDVIKKYNEKQKTKLPLLTYERLLALIFNELENLYNILQEGNVDHFYDLYYNYWLHTDVEIDVISSEGTKQELKIIGIDRFGFLECQDNEGNISTVHPDGNSFDMLAGLIAPSLSR
ncbi:biotin--protein ligase [Fopius arisanus]|uniref:Biotin--protein ligase n=2 Tax=Fopius arisanus TaxID=64838 RepID=A0A0C9R896_9HYME|nr:PREDICTED: biotin--protein ligase [Fopius arisanus]